MDQPASKGLQVTFLIHGIVVLVFGLALLLVPGRSLVLLGWVPKQVQLPESELSIPGQTFVDPVITRLLGASLLAVATFSLRVWTKAIHSAKEVQHIVEFEAVYCALSILAILIAMFTMQRTAGIIVWAILLGYAAFFVAWVLLWQAGRKKVG